jgi:hypothetical protein
MRVVIFQEQISKCLKTLLHNPIDRFELNRNIFDMVVFILDFPHKISQLFQLL